MNLMRSRARLALCLYEHCASILRSCRFVSHVFAEHNWEQKRSDVIEFDADMFAMGADWQGAFDELSDLCDVVYLELHRGRFNDETEVLCSAAYQRPAHGWLRMDR